MYMKTEQSAILVDCLKNKIISIKAGYFTSRQLTNLVKIIFSLGVYIFQDEKTITYHTSENYARFIVQLDAISSLLATVL